MTQGRIAVLSGLAAEAYERHGLHGEHRIWVEKNCYVDVWIELLHCLKLEPLALMPFTLASDFEGDHWTFFKPPLSDLQALYGINVQELNVWRPLLDHAIEHLSAGKLISTEADAFWLPDTAGTDYRQQHVKTTIVLNELDVKNQRLGYFHNAGYYALEGEDFRRLFNVDGSTRSDSLPLYAELIRLDRVVHRPAAELAQCALRLLREQLAYRPLDNPVTRFADRFAADLPGLQEKGLTHYHTWAFTTLRQLGAAFELAGAHLNWLERLTSRGLADSASQFEQIAQDCKGLILKVARVVNGKRAFDPHDALASTAQAWAAGMSQLDQALGSAASA
ncbi:MAG: DUF1839 family protein [Rhizobacter sp.]